MKLYISFGILFVDLFFSACSTKQVFEPAHLDQEWTKYKHSKDGIIDTSYDVALLEHDKVLTDNGVVDVAIEKEHRIISNSDGWILSASIDGNLTLTSIDDKTLRENFELKKTIASASVHGDNLAVLFADNELSLYSISTKEIFFNEQGTESLAVNTKIVNPYFINDLVLFSTLDGKVIIVNLKLKKKLRTVIVSTEDNFNNVIYLNMIDNKIIAATGYKILSMADKEIRVSYESRNIVYDGKNVIIATKQGEIVSLTPDLQLNAKIKFPFAHFLGMIAYEGKLYILEREGYMIVLDKNLIDYSVHETDIEDGYKFISQNVFYIDDEQILIK